MKVVVSILFVITLATAIFAFREKDSSQSEIIPNYNPALCSASPLEPKSSFLGLAELYIEEPRARELIKEIGVDFIRVEFRWDRIEPKEGEYNWEYVDEIFTYLNSENLEILATLNHPPVWAHDIQKLSSHFDNFLQAFISRYGDHIEYYEIFNEPNLPGYGWPFKTENIEHDARLYASVLTNASIKIRALAPNAFIVFGGLSPDGWPPRTFLEFVYKQSNPECFDILSYHPYGQAHRLVELQKELELFVKNQNDENKMIWFAEFGATDEEIAVEIIEKLALDLPKLNGVIWFSLRDLKPYGWNFGLVEYDWEKKPAFEAFKTIFKN